MGGAEGFCGRRVLLVEDDAIIAIHLGQIVERLGGEVAGITARVEQALLLIDRDTPDAAILDVNLGHGRDSYPVARALAERGVPFLFITGYGARGVEPEFRDHPVLDKPVVERDLARTVQALCASRARREAVLSA